MIIRRSMGSFGDSVWNTGIVNGKVAMTCVPRESSTGAEPHGPCSDFTDPTAYNDCLKRYGTVCGTGGTATTTTKPGLSTGVMAAVGAVAAFAVWKLTKKR